MRPTNYIGKHAYRGNVASNYESERVIEAIWEQEQQFVGNWIRTVPKGSSILDVPAGTGRFIELFLEQQLHIYAVDISEDMLAEVRRKYPNDTENLNIRRGDAEQLSFEDNTMDYVVSWRFFHLIPLSVVRIVLGELKRVCRGTIIVQVFAVESSTRRVTWVSKLKSSVRPWWRRINPGSHTVPTTPWSHIQSFTHNEGDLLTAIKEAGLTIEKIETLETHGDSATKVFFLKSPAASWSMPA